MKNYQEIERKAHELKELKRMAEELAAEIETIEDELKEYMKEEEVEQMIVGEYKITYKTVISNRFDSTSFKKAMPEIAQQFIKQTETKRFSLN